ncbi:MAG TPA: ABC transporter permease [Thermoplasmata archaeon]|nr:ABC transporter permease [Thermoplasmata archaeon]
MSGELAYPAHLPDSVGHTFIITKYELLNYFRTRRFYILLAIGVVISGILTALVGYYRPHALLATPLTFYSSWWGGAINFVTILAGIFFGGDAISGEFQNKTGYFVVGHPIRRVSIYAGKWIAALIAAVIVYFVYTGIAVANGLYYFGATIPWQLYEAIGLGLLYLIAVLAFTFLFSSLFKSSAMSILVTAILLLFGFSLIETLIATFTGIEPWFIITYGGGIVSNSLMDPFPAHVQDVPLGPRAGSLVVYTASVPEGIVILLAYFVVCAILGLLLFEMKEFT